MDCLDNLELTPKINKQMKREFFFAIVALFFLSSCHSQSTLIPDDRPSEPEYLTLNVGMDLEENPAFRMALIESGGKLHYRWKTGDKIYLYVAFHSTVYGPLGPKSISQLNGELAENVTNSQVNVFPQCVVLTDENISMGGRSCHFSVSVPAVLYTHERMQWIRPNIYLVASTSPLFRRHNSLSNPDNIDAGEEISNQVTSMYCDNIFLPIDDVCNLNNRIPHIAISDPMGVEGLFSANVSLKMRNLGITFLVDVTYEGSDSNLQNPDLRLNTIFADNEYKPTDSWRRPVEKYCAIDSPIDPALSFVPAFNTDGTQFFNKLIRRDRLFEEVCTPSSRAYTLPKNVTKTLVAFGFPANDKGEVLDVKKVNKKAKMKTVELLYKAAGGTSCVSVTPNGEEGVFFAAKKVYKLPAVKITDAGISRK